jgi:predicted amidohydrolase YtcJ
MDGERFNSLVARATHAGLATAVHAIGDRANRRALDGFAAVAGQAATSGLRQRIEHAQLLAPEDVHRFAKLGVAASMQPIHATADMAMADRYWGPRAAGAYAWRALRDSGALMAFGSDAPIESLDVFAGVHAAVTRQDIKGRPDGGWRSEQCIAVRHALAAYTIGAACAAGVESDLGSLELGKRADLIVLDQDPLQVPPAALPKVQVLGTMIEGVWVWQASGAQLGGPRQGP